MSKRFAGAMRLTLLFVCSSFAGCGIGRGPQILDDRACVIGSITETEAGILRIEHRGVLAGDLIVTQQCMINYGEDLTNETLHLTR